MNKVSVNCFQTRLDYGFEYLGTIKRIALTVLTERMHLIYMISLKASMGSAALGPAGTGKSETTIDLAKTCGKAILLYGCSETVTSETFVRILKGMAITGSWMCFD